MDADRDEQDARCPDCNALASRVLPLGWLFQCDPCGLKWGHPQGLDRLTATEWLHDLRRRTAGVPVSDANDPLVQHVIANLRPIEGIKAEIAKAREGLRAAGQTNPLLGNES